MRTTGRAAAIAVTAVLVVACGGSASPTAATNRRESVVSSGRSPTVAIDSASSDRASSRLVRGM